MQRVMMSASIACTAVLIVEADILVRMEAADTVRDVGLTAHEAADADEALATLTAHPEIGIVLLDSEASGTMDGLALARFVRDRWPPVRLILVCGGLTRQDQLPADVMLARKPYQTQQISALLRDASLAPA